MKGHQDEQLGTMDICETLNVKCDHISKLKWKEDQHSRESMPQEVNIQDKIWRHFTNVSMRSEKNTPNEGVKYLQIK